MWKNLLSALVTPENLIGLFKFVFPMLAPIILKMIEARIGGPVGPRWPTAEELEQEFNENADMYIAEGEAWLKAHPER